MAVAPVSGGKTTPAGWRGFKPNDQELLRPFDEPGDQAPDVTQSSVYAAPAIVTSLL